MRTTPWRSSPSGNLEDERERAGWRAVLGYLPIADDNAVDPIGHGSTSTVRRPRDLASGQDVGRATDEPAATAGPLVSLLHSDVQEQLGCGVIVLEHQHTVLVEVDPCSDTISRRTGRRTPTGGRARPRWPAWQPETNKLIHSHATEIYYILEGSGALTTGGTLQDERASDLTRLGAGVGQSGVHVGGTSCKTAHTTS
jgi:mannose-6-phosphate isomerase-like protein (cupin superfamily)